MLGPTGQIPQQLYGGKRARAEDLLFGDGHGGRKRENHPHQLAWRVGFRTCRTQLRIVDHRERLPDDLGEHEREHRRTGE